MKYVLKIETGNLDVYKHICKVLAVKRLRKLLNTFWKIVLYQITLIQQKCKDNKKLKWVFDSQKELAIDKDNVDD